MIDRICISLNKTCNMACRYCHFFNKKEKLESTEALTEERLGIILNHVMEYTEEKAAPFKIGLVGSGEPTLRFDLMKYAVEVIKAGGRENIRFYTISNGLCLTGEMFEFLAENGSWIDFSFSLDGPEALNDISRIDKSGRGTYARVMKNIERYQTRVGKPVLVNCTVSRDTIRESKTVFAGFGSFQPTFSRLVDSSASPGKGEFARFLKEAAEYGFDLRQLRTEKLRQYDCTMYGSLCGVGRNNPYFAGDKVYPCGRFTGMPEYEIGTGETPLSELEEKMKQIRHDGRTCYYEEFV